MGQAGGTGGFVGVGYCFLPFDPHIAKSYPSKIHKFSKGGLEMANNVMMEEFLTRHGGKGAVSKAEREAEQKVSVTPITRVTPITPQGVTSITHKTVTPITRVHRNCLTCTCEAKVYSSNAERQRAYRARKK